MAALTLRSVTVSNITNDGKIIAKHALPCDLSFYNQMPGVVGIQVLEGLARTTDEATAEPQQPQAQLMAEFTITTTGTDVARLGDRAHIVNLPGGAETLHLHFASVADSSAFRAMIIAAARSAAAAANEPPSSSVFSRRTDETSASHYFQFYGCLSQQQNMLHDIIRTTTYQLAIEGNRSDFQGKVVLDVGAGSGILSFFAAAAGAARVYAVEASGTMAEHAQRLITANRLDDVIEVIAGKVEEIAELPQPVDIIVSEPMGYMLYNERMLETFLHAKKWLKPGGKMFPSRADLHVAPFRDEALYMEQYNKAVFWCQRTFHGVDLSALHAAAMEEYFRQPVVDTFDSRCCIAESVRHSCDFRQADESDLHRIVIPLAYDVCESGTCHGLAFWFDVEFDGTDLPVWLTTAPSEPLTHWYQVRCLLMHPIYVKRGQLIGGQVVMVANKRQSYDVTMELYIVGTEVSASNTMDLKNPYFRCSDGGGATTTTQTQMPATTTTTPMGRGGDGVNGDGSGWGQQEDMQPQIQPQFAMQNGNGIVDLPLDFAHHLINTTLHGGHGVREYNGEQPIIHPGSICSTGRNGRSAAPQQSNGGVGFTLTPSVGGGGGLSSVSPSGSLLNGAVVVPADQVDQQQQMMQ